MFFSLDTLGNAVFAMLLAVSIFSSAEAQETKFHALVIGNSDYQQGPLDNPSNDAALIAETLGDMGFKVTKKLNLDHPQMEQVISQFCRTLPEDSLALYYFAGHGVQVGGLNYLVPIGAKLETAALVKFHAVAQNYVIEELSNSNAKMKVVVLDCCRDNPFERSWKRNIRSSGLAPILNARDIPEGIVIGYATSTGMTAIDGGAAGNSPYTIELTKAFKARPKSGLKLNDVFRIASRKTYKKTGQRPDLHCPPYQDEFFLIAPDSQLLAEQDTKPKNELKASTVVMAEAVKPHPDKLPPRSDPKYLPPPRQFELLHEDTPSNQGLRRSVVEAVKIIPKYHFSGRPFDDLIARRVATLLPDALDPNHLYLEYHDVATFRANIYRLDDQFRNGQLDSIYQLVETYIRRVHQRVEWVEPLLRENHDFSVDETMVLDPEGSYLTVDQLRDQWRKYVKRELLVHQETGASLPEAIQIARKRFGNLIDNARKWNDTDVVAKAIDNLAKAYDPQSSYFSPRQIENFYIDQQRKLEGIGASLQVIDSYVTVKKIISGGPAAQDGRLKAGDRIVAVGQGTDGALVDIIAVRLEDAVDLIRGAANTTVRLKVLSEGRFDAQIFELKRGVVRLVSSLQNAIVPAEHNPDGRSGKVGWIRCAYFYQDIRNKEDPHRASVDLEKILKQYQRDNVELLVLDLRSCTGGTLSEAFAVAGLFLGDVAVTQVQDGTGKVESYTTQVKQPTWKEPVVILIDRFTASGGELLVAAMKDHSRCLVVGDERTYGTGTSQNLIDIKKVLEEASFEDADEEEIPNLGMLKLTTQRFYSPLGASPQKIGVTSDIVLPSVYNVQASQGADQKFSLESDSIKATKTTPFGMIDEKIRGELKDLSKSRVAGSSYFQDTQVKIDEYLAKQESAAGRFVYSLKLQDPANASPTEAPVEPSKMLIEDPRVPIDGYLKEVLNIGLDYLARLTYLDAEKDYTARKYTTAVKKYRRVLEFDPAYARGHHKLGWVLATSTIAGVKDPAQAVKHCQSACKLDGFNKWSYLVSLAVAESEAGDFDAATDHLKTALEKAPEKHAAKYRYLVQKFENRKSYSSK